MFALGKTKDGHVRGVAAECVRRGESDSFWQKKFMVR